jgi:hypothetical protein
MTHSLHGTDNHGNDRGFTALGKSIGTPNSTDKDSAYVTEHPVLKYFRAKLANFLNDFRRADWFSRLGLPVSNGRHNQLTESHVRRLMRRVEQRVGFRGGGRGREHRIPSAHAKRPPVFSQLRNHFKFHNYNYNKYLKP